jgi:hypothetical protein
MYVLVNSSLSPEVVSCLLYKQPLALKEDALLTFLTCYPKGECPLSIIEAILNSGLSFAYFTEQEALFKAIFGKNLRAKTLRYLVQNQAACVITGYRSAAWGNALTYYTLHNLL